MDKASTRTGRLFRAVFIAAFAAAVLAVDAAPAPRWTLVEVTMPGAVGTFARGINNRGEVTGELIISRPFGGTAFHPFIWRDGVMSDLGSPLGSTFMSVGGINDRGDIVATDTASGSVPFLWKDGVWTRLAFGNGGASSVNKFDDMAGTYLPPGGQFPRAFALANGSFTDVGTLGGTSAVAHAINDHGAVVGSASTPGNSSAHAFMYKAGVMTDLGILPDGRNSEARAVNDHGVAVGNCDLPNQNFRTVACVFEAGKPARMLFDVPGLHEASAINNHGDVVGDFFNGHSFVYRDGVVTQLDDIPAVRAGGWSGVAPVGINDHGWIVGTGTHEGQFPRTFVLIPR
jgi:probable HAF family extracellular repeat protein